jgi:hypothetical protein
MICDIRLLLLLHKPERNSSWMSSDRHGRSVSNLCRFARSLLLRSLRVPTQLWMTKEFSGFDTIWCWCLPNGIMGGEWWSWCWLQDHIMVSSMWFQQMDAWCIITANGEWWSWCWLQDHIDGSFLPHCILIVMFIFLLPIDDVHSYGMELFS